MVERRLWTSDEFGRMIDVGLLAARGYELIHGVVYNTSGVMRRWSAGDYETMVEAGILLAEERAGLIEGVPYRGPTARTITASARMRFMQVVHPMLDRRVMLGAGGDRIVLDDANVASPDICLLKWRDDFYASRWPSADDLFATVEFSYPPIHTGSDARRRQLARFGVPEFWHFDLGARELVLHRAPADGDYTDVRAHAVGEQFSSPVLGLPPIPMASLMGRTARAQAAVEG
jgi:hypothetical protein